MLRIPYVGPSGCASKREVEGDRSLEEVVRSGGEEQGKQARIEPWLRDLEGQDRGEMKREVEGRVGRRRD